MKRHLFVILFGFLGVQGFSQTMHTLGAEILGQSTSEEIGETIDFSSDGSTYIISSNSYGSGQGRVAVLELTEDDYSLKGSPIVGSTNERIGLDVSVDGDGSVIAFSSNRGSLLGTNGFVRVYAWNGSSWVQRGSDLTEGTEGYGSRVKISAGGNIVAVSAPFENSQTGAVYVYEFDGSDWVQVGNSFTSSASYSGFTLDMSDDGTRVALGHNSGNGAVAIYQNLSNTWSLMGSEITGSSASGDYFGARLSLSGDGSTIAIGAYSHSTTSTNRGMVEVFEWDSNTTSWIQKGSTIEGSGTGALLGFSLDLNTTGDVMVIAESGTGYAYLVNYSTTWGGLSTQSITTVSSDGFTGSSGEGLALIGSGYRYAVGLRRKDNGAIVDAGAVQVYSYGYEESTNDVLCPATVYSFGSQSLTSGGNYIEMMASSEGYDSLVYLTLTENDLAIAGVSTNSTNNLCFGDANGTISITANSGSTPYEYSIGGAYQSSNTFTGLSAGTYTASVRDAEGCVVSQTGITITEPAQLGLNLAQTQPVSCDGDTDGSLTVSAIGGTSPYTYSLDGTNFQPSGNFDNLTNATYDIYARDANSCTALIHSTAISVNDTQNPVITSANTASFDDGGSGTAYLVEATDNCAVTMYSITGGADASLFTINSTTGAVAFVASPDYSNPQDFDKDNVYAIEVEAEDFSGNVASLSVNISVEDIVLAGFAYTWTGATSSDWNDASNWDISTPGAGSNIIIEPAGNQPVIPSASVVRTQDLAVVSGANLTLESGATLQVNGNLVGNGTYTVKRNTTGNIGYSIVGSPIADAMISDLNASILYDYDGANYTVPSGSMMPGKGYFAAYQTMSPEINLTGQLNFGTITLPLHADGDQFNLVANPYTAPISRASFLSVNDQNVIDGNIWFWDDGGANNGSDRGGNYILVNNLGQVSTVDLSDGIPGQSGPNASHDRIPSFQGFLVRSQQATNLTFEQSMQANLSGANDDGVFYRTDEPIQKIKLSLSNDRYYNELIVGLLDEATFGQDFALDGPKLSVKPEFSFHSLLIGEAYAIQAIPRVKTEVIDVPLELTIKQSGAYHLRVDELTNFASESVSLVDHELGTSKPLTAGDQFTLDLKVGTHSKRFALRFSPDRVLNVDPAISDIVVFGSANKLQLIASQTDGKHQVSIHNLSGRLIFEDEVVFVNGKASISPSISKDQVYILRLNDQSIKFILQ